MNLDQPPIIDPSGNAHLPPPKPANLARLGMRLSLIAPAVVLLFLVFRPG